MNIGDVVQLKSGGPKMTVNELYSDGTVYCVWFTEAEQKGGTFQPAVLQSFRESQTAKSSGGGAGGPHSWMG